MRQRSVGWGKSNAGRLLIALVVSAGSVATTIPSSVSARSAWGAVSSGPTLFVPTQQFADVGSTQLKTKTSVTPVLTGTNRAGAPIATGSVVNSWTDAIAIAPDGRTAYAFGAEADGLVPIDVATGTAGSPITLPIRNDMVQYRGDMVAISPDGTTAYVAGGEDDDVIPVNLATRTAGRPITPYSGNPTPFVDVEGVAITPDGKSLLVTKSDRTITTVAISTGRVVRTAKVLGFPDAIVIAPDGQTAYVVAANTVIPFAVATLRHSAPIQIHRLITDIAIAPDGRNAYVISLENQLTVTPINLATNTAGQPIKTTAIVDPLSIVVSPDGATIYVETSGSDTRKWNSVMAFDRSTKRLRTTTSLDSAPNFGFGQFSDQMAITPDQAPVAVLSVTPGAVGSATKFSAAGSAGPTSPIVSYRWNFGDGTTATTTAPTTTHVYRSAKTYSASVIETDKAGTSTQKVFTGQTMSRNGGPSATATAAVVIS